MALHGSDLEDINIYTTAFYFTVSTATTVGYGDYYGTTFSEKLFLIFLQFSGICIYSLIQGLINGLTFAPVLDEIIADRVEEIKDYIQAVDMT